MRFYIFNMLYDFALVRNFINNLFYENKQKMYEL